MVVPKLPDLTGRVYIVTGGNTGIGYYTCLHLAERNAHVYMGARSTEKASKAISSIKELHPSANLTHLLVEHASLASVSAAVRTFKEHETSLHGLVNNAGIMATPYEITADGNEAQWQTNYLAHWLLTSLLLPTLLATARSPSTPKGAVRVVNVSSVGHRFASEPGIDFAHPELESASGMKRYGQAKLANILHARTLNELYGPNSRSASSGEGEIWTSSLHPGAVNTQLNTQAEIPGFGWMQPTLKFLGVYVTPEQGATANLFCAASDDFTRKMSGEYFNEKAKLGSPGKLTRNVELRRKLESWTEEKMKSEKWI